MTSWYKPIHHNLSVSCQVVGFDIGYHEAIRDKVTDRLWCIGLCQDVV